MEFLDFSCHSDFACNQFWIIWKYRNSLFAILGTLNFVTWQICISLQNVKKFIKKSKFIKCWNGLLWFHVKSEWQKNLAISILLISQSGLICCIYRITLKKYPNFWGPQICKVENTVAIFKDSIAWWCQKLSFDNFQFSPPLEQGSHLSLVKLIRNTSCPT